MTKEKLVIFPHNGNGKEAIDCIDFDKYELIGFIDDDINKKSKDYPLFSRDIFMKIPDLKVLAVPGSPISFRSRKEVIHSLRIDKEKFISIIHPKASVGKGVKIGYNCLIMSGVVLTSNVVIKNHVCILPNTVIHHDTVIGDYALIGSNVVIAGGCEIGENCYIGSGTNVINGVQVGNGALVGLGSNIINNVPVNAKMVGNPARNLKSL